MSKAYLYSPEGLAENFRKLKQEEDELVKTLDIDDNDRITRTSDQQEDNYIVAAVQLTGREFEKDEVRGFLNLAMHAVGEAAKKGANVILLPELFLGPYFCQTQEACLMEMAMEDENCFLIKKFQLIAKQNAVVLPLSFYERCGNMLYNSVVMIDADGSILGKYRKTHIPDGKTCKAVSSKLS